MLPFPTVVANKDLSTPSTSNLHIKPTVTRIPQKPVLAEKRKASDCMPSSCPVPKKMPVYKILLNPLKSAKPNVKQIKLPVIPLDKKRHTVSKYPAVPPGTKTYSRYNFPDPKNLMQLPEHDCKFCPAMFSTIFNWSKHAYLVHNKMLCPECHSVFENRSEYEHHIVLEHNQAPLLHSCFFQEFGNKSCSFCDDEFSTFRELYKHIRERECHILPTMLTGDAKLPGDKRYVCNFCGEVGFHKKNL